MSERRFGILFQWNNFRIQMANTIQNGFVFSRVVFFSLSLLCCALCRSVEEWNALEFRFIVCTNELNNCVSCAWIAVVLVRRQAIMKLSFWLLWFTFWNGFGFMMLFGQTKRFSFFPFLSLSLFLCFGSLFKNITKRRLPQLIPLARVSQSSGWRWVSFNDNFCFEFDCGSQTRN